MRRLPRAIPLAPALALAISLAAPAPADAPPADVAAAPPVLETTAVTLPALKTTTLSGDEIDLSRYRGKAILFVNVASECGYTPQYAGLQDLHAKYAERGLAVVGVPANDFGRQEPGTNEQIAGFCRKNYGVEFDMLSKRDTIVGERKDPLYAWLTSAEANPATAGEVKWNFEKFVVGRDGKLVARFPSKVAPDDPALIAAVESALAARPAG